MSSFFYESCLGRPLQYSGDAMIYTKYFSPLDLLPFKPGYYQKGQSINQIPLQENEFFACKESFFSRYQVYENLSGWNQNGKIHPKNYKLTRCGSWYSGYSASPILIGDFYDLSLSQVVWSSGYYDERFGLFKVRFQTGVLRPFVPVTKENLLNTELHNLEVFLLDAFTSVIDALGNFSDLFTIVNIGNPTQGWATPPSSIMLNAQVLKSQQQIQKKTLDIQNQIKKIQELRW